MRFMTRKAHQSLSRYLFYYLVSMELTYRNLWQNKCGPREKEEVFQTLPHQSMNASPASRLFPAIPSDPLSPSQGNEPTKAIISRHPIPESNLMRLCYPTSGRARRLFDGETRPPGTADRQGRDFPPGAEPVANSVVSRGACVLALPAALLAARRARPPARWRAWRLFPALDSSPP